MIKKFVFFALCIIEICTTFCVGCVAHKADAIGTTRTGKLTDMEATVDATFNSFPDDDKSLTGDELLMSTLLGNHSFIVAGNNELMNFASNEGDILDMGKLYTLYS